MSTPTPHEPVPQLSAQGIPEPRILEQRLEAIDQALVGLLPRHERLAAVAQVETRIRELAMASPAGTGMPQALPLPDPTASQPALGTTGFLQNPQHFAAAPGGCATGGCAPGGWMPAAKKKRSRLAVTAGVIGILALALMFATPVTYFMVMLLSELLGEIVAYVLLGAHVIAITTAGLAAVALGIVALLNLWRRKDQLAGHGWAITALCTGPLPVLAGCSAVLLIALEMGAFEYFTTTVSVASDDGSTNASLAELRSEVEKLRNEIRTDGHIYPTSSSESSDSTGVPPACAPASSPSSGNWPRSSSPEPEYCAPACAAPTCAAPTCAAPVASLGVPQPSIHAAAHVAPAAAAQPPVVNAAGAVPARSAAPVFIPRAAPVPPAAAQPAPHPDAPAEPAEMPESAPVISQ